MLVQLQQVAHGPREDHFLNFVYQPLREATGDISGILAHGVDVTDQVRAQQEIEYTAEELRRLAQALEQTNRELRLTKMIHALFDLSRFQIGQFTIERQPVDIGRLARCITADLEPTLERHTLHLEMADAPLLILGDELRLEQVIQNLVHNAMKYSLAGGPVVVRVDQHDGWVRLSVEDQGIGIPANRSPICFSAFTGRRTPHPTGLAGWA